MVRRIASVTSFVLLAVGAGIAGCDTEYDPQVGIGGGGTDSGAGQGTSNDAGGTTIITPSNSADGGGSSEDAGPSVADDSGSSSANDGGTSGSDDATTSGGGDEGGPPVGTGAACSCAGGPANCAVWTNVFMTNYGFFDNSCNQENQHTCNTIAFPGLGPQKHAYATEATGTYDDPITAAAAADNGGTSELESQGGATLSPGTIIYNPLTQKYYIMEDQCAECTADYNCKYDDDEPKTFPNNPPAGCVKDTYFHIDFWMGPSFLTDSTNIQNCEDNATIGDVYEATQGPLDSGASGGTVIINPPNNLPVRPGLLFTGVDAGNGGCWTATQALPDEEVCN